MSLYQTVRPEKLDHVVGQPEAVTILKNAIAAKDRQHAGALGKLVAASILIASTADCPPLSAEITSI